MPCRGLRRALRLYYNVLSFACFLSGRSSAAAGYPCPTSNGAKGGSFEESHIGVWCAGPSNRVPRGTRRGRHHRRLNSGGEGWFLRINGAVRSGRARGGCVGGGKRGREARRQCGWCLCGAFPG